MDLTTKEAFRLGFLARCSEEGLTGQDLADRLASVTEKQALGGLFGGLGAGANGFATILGLPAAAGLLGGAGLGYGAAKLTDPGISADDIKAQELAETYRMYAAKARANRKAHQYRTAR